MGRLPGLYDDDESTDIVYYDPLTGTFSMLLSKHGWAQSQRVDHVFPNSVIPFGHGNDPNGAMVMRRAEGRRLVCRPGWPPICVPIVRRVLQLWEEASGNWYTMWDPVNSSSLSTCQWGTSLDIPLSGKIDRDGDGKSDYVVWRSSSADLGGILYIRESANGTCSGSTSQLGTLFSPGTMAFPVWDMNGDAKDEIMLLHPYGNKWWRYDSNGYNNSVSHELGGMGAIPL